MRHKSLSMRMTYLTQGTRISAHQCMAHSGTMRYTVCSCSRQDTSAEPHAAPSDGLSALHRDSFSSAVQHRRSMHSEQTLVLDNVGVLDVQSGKIAEGCMVSIQHGRITSMQAAGTPAEDNAVVLDCRGLTCMPGLCDAHVHCTAASANLASLLSLPESLVTAHATKILEGMISRGFTTVRDAGGADFGLAKAVEDGLILGPRILFTGHALSQTGGHGDMRQAGEDICACGAALRGIGRVCDGDAEVRRAARDELRKGAHCIKIMASGGVASPTDRLTNTQFSMAELKAIVEEAEAAGTYVCAHAYMPSAITRAVEAGVRSIEHGNWLDERTAQLMADKGTLLVPTTVTYAALSAAGREAGMPAELVAKVGDAVEQGLQSMVIAHKAGVTQCYGSDLLGALHDRQLQEFKLRGSVLPPEVVLQAATCNCEQLFCMQGCIGQVRPGYQADLVLVAGGNPAADLSLLHESPSQCTATAGARGVVAVFKAGLLVRGCVHGLTEDSQALPLNTALFAADPAVA